jgi:hypothetical protein
MCAGRLTLGLMGKVGRHGPCSPCSANNSAAAFEREAQSLSTVHVRARFARRKSSRAARTLPSQPAGASLVLVLRPSLVPRHATLLQPTDLRLMQADMARTDEAEHKKTSVVQAAEEVCGLKPDG